MNRARTAALLLALAALPAGAVDVEILDRVSPRLASETAGGASQALAISADGRYVVFLSAAINLAPGMAASPPGSHFFLYDRVTGTATRISRRPTSDSFPPQAAISADGRFVAFHSRATGEVEGQNDPNEQGPDVFLWDRETGETKLVSHSHQGPTRTGDSYSFEPVLSADGRFVAFTSNATDLLGEENSPSSVSNVFLWDRQTGETVPASHPAGAPGQRAGSESLHPSISADGRFVAFMSNARNLVAGQRERIPRYTLDAFLWDRTTRQTFLVSRAAGNPRVTANRFSYDARVSADGRFVALRSSATDLLPGRRGGAENVFLWERATGAMTLVSHGRDGESPIRTGSTSLDALSADGSHVLFSSNSRDLVAGSGNEPRSMNLFLWSRATGRHTLVSRAAARGNAGNGDSFSGHLSADGAWIVFQSAATNLADGAGDDNGQVDVFLADGRSGQITLLSASREDSGETAGGESFDPLISADGQWAAFTSSAPDLVADAQDLNLRPDVILAGRGGERIIASVHPPALASATPLGNSSTLSIDASGRFVVVASEAEASQLVPGIHDRNGFQSDLFLYDRELRTFTLVTRSVTDPESTADGTSAPDARISADGRWVVFTSNASDLVPGFTNSDLPFSNVFLWDRTTGRTLLLSRSAGSSTAGGNSNSNEPRISADGSVVVFQSFASGLVPGQAGPEELANIFLFDRTTETVSLVSRAAGSATVVGSGHSILPKLSADGRIVAFTSSSMDLVPGATDTNDYDVFLFDRTSGVTTLASRAAASALLADDGSSTGFALSANGRFVVFESSARDLVPGQTDRPFTSDLFLFDRITGTTTLVSHEAGSPTAAVAFGTYEADLSADGRFIAFSSMAKDLVPGQVDREGARRGTVDIFVYDRETGATELVTRTAGTVATAAPGQSLNPVISADGRRVAFVSSRLDLAPGLHGSQTGFDLLNLFVYDRPSGTNTLVTHTLRDPAQVSFGSSSNHFLNANGSVVAFTSTAPDLLSRDFNLSSDAFAANLP